MSTNGQLVFTDVDKITFKGVGNTSNAVVDTLTGKIGVGTDSPEANLHVLGNSYVSTNLELGGTLIMGTVNVEAQHSLEAVTATGNITPLTVEFTNPTTSLVASGNVVVTGNVTAGYLYGDGSNISGISSTLQAITDSGPGANVTSNTVQFTNPMTSLVASGNVEVGGDVVLSGNIYNNANLSVQYTTIIPAWTQVGSDIDGEAAGDWSGYSVSMSSDGTRMAIGGHYNDGTGTDAGHVRVYDWDSGTSAWTQVGSDIDGEAGSDKSGCSVSISSNGTRVAIGAWGNDNGTGHVRVYSESGGTWTQVGSDIDGEAAYDYSGWSVSMSSDGTRVAIGADGEDPSAGHVRVYSESGGTWTKVGSNIDGEAADDRSGYSVSMSSDGTRVAIGATRNDGTGYNAGHVRVYSESGGTWTQVGSDIDGEAANDYCGWSVSMSSDGTRVAIGATRNDGTAGDAGHVRVYSESGGTWTKVGSDIDGEAASDQSGYSVSISSDGTRVAIGAIKNDGNGSDAGHVRVYAESSGTWTQVGQDIDGEAAGDESGRSVSMSSDGTRVAIGASRNDGNGSDAGHVRVFDWPMITGSKKILKENIVEVGGELTVSGNATVSSNLTVSGDATVSSNLTVSGLLTSASGGTETQITDQGISYKVHSFTSTGTTQITVDKAGFFECLVVAGGGAGGRSNAAGGGGGGVVIQRVFVHTGTYDVVVGAGNTNGVRDPRDGNANGGTYPTRTYSEYPIGYRGENSSVFGLLAIGGGNGGGDDYSGIDGGSGGGCADDELVIPGRSVQNQEGSNGYGNRGGYTRFNASAGSGGGGAGEPGYDCDPDRYLAEANSTWFLLGRDGGNGVGSTIRTGSMQYYGGGGGGADRSTAPADQPRAGVGGKGGGGNGGSQNGTGSAGSTNTGGGGGGTSHNSGNGGNGGSGIVVVRYKI